MNWKQDNLMTKEMGQECYETLDLVQLFTELQDDGYTGLSLGLIIDLVRDRLEVV